MRRNINTGRLLAVTLGCTVMTACSTLNDAIPDRRVDYKQSKTTSTLEVPPDLTSSTIDDSLVVPEISPDSTASYSDYSAERLTAGGVATTVLPQQTDIRVEREGDRRWLVINAESEQVWPRVRDFWSENGFLLKMEDPRIGIMETGWAENRADIPQGPIRNVIGKALDSLYSAATRDSYRVRMERGVRAGTTELYLTHRGMEEVVVGTPAEGGNTVWKPRPADPELEVEMLKRLMVHLGSEQKRADSQLGKEERRSETAQLVRDTDGNTALAINEDFARAWRRTGIALDRVGFAVEDRDRAKGIYYVRYHDPVKEQKSEGFLSKLNFWSSDKPTEDQPRYQVHVIDQEGRCQVVVEDASGQRDNSSTAQRILTLLHEQLS